MIFTVKIDKYIFTGSNLNPEDINFFSNTSKTLWGSVTLDSSRDIIEYTNLRFTHDTEDDGEIEIIASNINFKISDIEPLRVRRGSVYEYYSPSTFFDVSLPMSTTMF